MRNSSQRYALLFTILGHLFYNKMYVVTRAKTCSKQKTNIKVVMIDHPAFTF